MSKVSKEKRKRSTSLFWKYLKFWPFDEPNSFWRFRSEISQFTESLYNLAKPRAIRPPRNSGPEFLFHSQEFRSRIMILIPFPETHVWNIESYSIPRNSGLKTRFLYHIPRNTGIESWFLFHSQEIRSEIKISYLKTRNSDIESWFLFHSKELRFKNQDSYSISRNSGS